MDEVVLWSAPNGVHDLDQLDQNGVQMNLVQNALGVE